ncbi:MAG: Rad52/Rad22 family DNA repair protein [Balneola sp.]
MNIEILRKRLSQPFHPNEIDWRVQRSGFSKDGNPYAFVLAYVQNRAIQERLDDVCGVDGWQNKFHQLSNGAMYCEIGIRINDEWIWKGDGAGETQVEATKGSFSDSMKRAGYQWGIGRYLYNLPSTYAKFDDDGVYFSKIKKDKNDKFGTGYNWNPPNLPNWALPSSEITTEIFEAMCNHLSGGGLSDLLLKLANYTLTKEQATELSNIIMSKKVA